VPVVVPARDEASFGYFAGEIARRADARFLLMAQIANAGVWRDEVVDKIGALVDDDQFAPRIILSREGADGHRARSRGDPWGHDAGDNRGRVIGNIHAKIPVH
jgi:hypothetical protein